MKIVALGDSFTYGEELVNRHDAWPQQLANKLGVQCRNLGVPGGSNDRIINELFDYLLSPGEADPNDLFVIGWTSPGRVEYADEVGNFDIWPGFNTAKFVKHEPWRTELSSYIDQYHSSQWLVRRFVQQVVMTQSLLSQRNFKYVMCDTVNNEYYKNQYLLPAYTACDLVDSSFYLGWKHSGMAEWVGKVPKGPGGHFLEQGHQIVADKLCKFIKENIWQR